MEINAVSEDITKQKVSAVVVNLFEGVSNPKGATGAVDQALDGAISKLILDGETTGKKGEITLIHTLDKIVPDRVVVVGLGKQSNFTCDVVREVSAKVCRFLRSKGIQDISTIAHGAGIGGMDPSESAQAITEGALLGLYRFSKYKTDNQTIDINQLSIVESDQSKISDLTEGISTGKILSDATNFCRSMANEPANHMTPTRMSELAQDVAKDGNLEIQVFDKDSIEKFQMGAFLGVALGSDQPPKLIVMKYIGDKDNLSNSVGFVGKGITFDTGGISIKPSMNMSEMKTDMSGGAAVISAMKAIGQLKPKINVTAVVPATENMIGSSAQRPGDIVKTMSGKTIEIDNTDAEGRLILADAIYYARSLGLERIVDVATLTGAITIALGKVCTGVFGNDQFLIDQVLLAGNQSGEKMWHLPTFHEYGNQYKSDVADIKNTGGRAAGSITGAKIIEEFTDGASWVHLDIAGTARSNSLDGDKVKGSTGVTVRTLVALAINLSKI